MTEPIKRVIGQRRPWFIEKEPKMQKLQDKGSAPTAKADAKSPAKSSSKISPEVVAKVRKMRNTPHPEKEGKSAYTHKQVADEVGLTPGQVSQIARNRTHVDPSYKPLHDGHLDTGPRDPAKVEANKKAREEAKQRAAEKKKERAEAAEAKAAAKKEGTKAA